jgi:hypothetical protein
VPDERCQGAVVKVSLWDKRHVLRHTDQALWAGNGDGAADPSTGDVVAALTTDASRWKLTTAV